MTAVLPNETEEGARHGHCPGENHEIRAIRTIRQCCRIPENH